MSTENSLHSERTNVGNAARATEENFQAMDSAEAYSSVALISTLVFGFATANITTVIGNKAGNSVSTAESMFIILMALSCILSAYGIVVMTLTFYHLKRLTSMPADKKQRIIQSYLAETFQFRNVARGTTWISLSLYLLAMPVYIYSIIKDVTIVILFVIFSFGSLLVFLVWRKFSKLYTGHYRSIYE